MLIHEKIIEMIEEAKPLPYPVSDTTNLYYDLRFDSLSFVSLLLKIEEHYLISFDIDEMELCLHVEHLISLVKKKVGRSNHSNDQTSAAKSE